MLPRSTKRWLCPSCSWKRWVWWMVSWGFLWVVLQQKVRGRHWESQQSQYFKVGRLVVELWASLGCGYGLFSERGRKVNDPFPHWRCDTMGKLEQVIQIDWPRKRVICLFQPSRNFNPPAASKKKSTSFLCYFGNPFLKISGGFSNHEWIHPIAWLIAPSRMMYHDWFAALRLGVKFWVIF